MQVRLRMPSIKMALVISEDCTVALEVEILLSHLRMSIELDMEEVVVPMELLPLHFQHKVVTKGLSGLMTLPKGPKLLLKLETLHTTIPLLTLLPLIQNKRHMGRLKFAAMQLQELLTGQILSAQEVLIS